MSDTEQRPRDESTEAQPLRDESTEAQPPRDAEHCCDGCDDNEVHEPVKEAPFELCKLLSVISTRLDVNGVRFGIKERTMLAKRARAGEREDGGYELDPGTTYMTLNLYQVKELISSYRLYDFIQEKLNEFMAQSILGYTKRKRSGTGDESGGSKCKRGDAGDESPQL